MNIFRMRNLRTIYPALKALRRVKRPRMDVAYVQNGRSAGRGKRKSPSREEEQEGRGGEHAVRRRGRRGSAWDTVCSETRAARVSHGHGVHCPEPRPQGHRPTEPIVPLLCSSTHFRWVLLLAIRVRPRPPPSTCITRVRRWLLLVLVRVFGACSVLRAFQKNAIFTRADGKDQPRKR